MTTMLADVIDGGTAWQARRVGFTLPAAGKTGTTNEYRDAWFVGYTPKLVAGVWVGYDRPRTIIGGGYAAELAVPLWGRFMMSATRGDKPEWFDPPRSVTSATICRLSGKLATDACRAAQPLTIDGSSSPRSMVYTEYFARGTEPIDFCPIHVRGMPIPQTLAVAHELPDTVLPPPPAPAPPAVAVVTGGTVATTTAQVETPRAEQAPPKKRGFWGRLFRRGGNDAKTKDNQK
jgi:penicillin-binding protein 1A